MELIKAIFVAITNRGRDALLIFEGHMFLNQSRTLRRMYVLIAFVTLIFITYYFRNVGGIGQVIAALLSPIAVIYLSTVFAQTYSYKK